MEMYQPTLTLNTIGRRRDSRLRLQLSARLETIHGNARVMLMDLSQSGGQVVTDEHLLSGKDAVLCWLHFEAFGRIVWSTPTQAGLEFAELLPASTLIDTRDMADLDTRKVDRRAAFDATRAWYNGCR